MTGGLKFVWVKHGNGFESSFDLRCGGSGGQVQQGIVIFGRIVGFHPGDDDNGGGEEVGLDGGHAVKSSFLVSGFSPFHLIFS